MRGDLLKSTPLSVTLSLIAVFVVALGVAAFTASQFITHELAARVDRAVADDFSVISQSYADGDISDLVASVNSHANAARGHDEVFRLTDAPGHLLAGNIGAREIPSGWSTVSAAMLGLEGALSYRIFAGKAASDQLVVGVSSAQSDEIAGLTASAFAGSAAIFTALILAVGILVARRAQRRLDGIADTMRRVGAGELDARIPLAGRRDDIAMLSLQVNAALDRLSALVEGMRQVSVDIAHDLKTPLNRLGITIEGALDSAAAGPTADLLLQAQREAQQINGTFEALLRIAQIEAGARRARFAAVRLADVAETIVDIYGEVAIERGQSLHFAAGPSSAEISGDRELLTQLLANLVENALRHGGDGVAVSISVASNANNVVLVVADTGPGIPIEEREKVFRRLYRLDKSRSGTGSGLGLSLVKAITDLHGGTVSLTDNSPGLIVEIAFHEAAEP